MLSDDHDGVKTIATTTTDLEIPAEAFLTEGLSDPCTILIVGASGDLTSRKLMPALYNLFLKDALPEPFRIVGCSRTELTDQSFRDRLKTFISKDDEIDLSKWEKFASFIQYHPIQYDQRSSFVELVGRLKELDEKSGTGGNRIIYFAIPPTLYKPTARMLGSVGLAAEGENGNGWSRIVVEKPFGRNLETAMVLDQSLHEFFKEHQIFRIDHYLAKETVQNILMFRFANAIFEPIWNRRYIDHVSITAAETLGVENRAGYYEQSGVLRDMFQNHMMQLLALTAIEPPSLFEADIVRDEKVKVFRSLRPFPLENLKDTLVLGQYTAGTINGNRVPAYRDEPGVQKESLTPTFASMKVFLDNWRWQGVPFYLTSGKRLGKKMTEISIQVKKIPHSMFRQTLGENITANLLILGIYPDEEITLTFQTKNPDPRVSLRSVTMDFLYNQNYTGPVLDAYEKVLLDCMLGDHMLFWRKDAVKLCWGFLTPILMECETCGNREDRLLPYEAGGWGPEAAKGLRMNQDKTGEFT
jgi:glucose-6-phosphate 1-dehydrogenase